MAENSDGSIILSVKVDDSGIKPQLNKLKSEIEDMAKKTDKVSNAFFKVNSQLTKAEIQSEKLKQAQEKTVQAVEKTAQEKAKTVQQTEKATQAELKTEQAVYSTLSAEQKALSAQEKTVQSKQRTYQEQEKTEQAVYKTLTAEEKAKQAVEKTTQAQNKTTQAQEKTKQAVEKTTQAQNTLKNATNSVLGSIKKMASALGVVYGIRELLNFSNEASKLASQTEAHLKRLGALYGEAAQDVYDFADANAYAFGMSKTAAYEASADYGNIFTTFADGAESAKLTNEMLQATAVIASRTGRTYEDVFEKIRSGLYGQTRAIDDLGVSVRKSQLVQTRAFQTVTGGVKKWNALTDAELQQVRALAIVEQAQQHYGNTVLQSTALTRSQFNAAWQDFKATWGQVINTILIPVLNVVTQILNAITAVMKKLSQFTSFGKENKSNSENESENTKKTASNIGIAAENQKQLNKELKKSIAGFDDLQILTDNKKSENGGAGGGILEDYTDDGGGGTTPPKGKSDFSYIKDALADLATAVGKALLAVGAIALFTGNIPLGLGLIAGGLALSYAGDVLGSDDPSKKIMDDLEKLKDFISDHLFEIGVILLFFNIPLGVAVIIGASIYEATKEDGFDEKTIEKKINIIMEYVAVGLVAIGVILVMFGQFAVGIGFIIAGKELLNVTEEKLQEGETKTKIQKFFEENQALIVGVGLALVVIALIIFAIGGVALFPVALGMLITGAAALATAEEMNEGAIKDTITNFLEENQALVVGVSLAMLVLGIILCATGVGLGFGIALIVAGAVGLVSEVVLNWDYIKKKVSETIDKVKDWISTWGLLVLGVLLCLTGVGIPLGIALIKKGGANLAEAENPVWNTFLDKVKEIWSSVKEYWDKHIAKYFTAKWWGDLAKTAINGFIEWVISGLNKLIRKINDFGFDVPDILGGGHVGFNIPEIKVPKLARGAVLPANQPFLAVVGDQKKGKNIEAPAELIKQMAMEAIVEAQGSLQGQQTVKEEHYYLNQTELMSVLYRLVKGGERIQGNSLVKQGGI
nr:MAG TPA: minor tail protein [Caudoviricetes sp.]